MKSLLILGAGGFGRMVAETAQVLGYEKVVFLDDAVKDEAVIGICCDYEIRHKEYPVAVAAFGNNKMRLYWTDKLLEEGYETSVCSCKSECGAGAGLFRDAESGGKYQYPDRTCGAGEQRGDRRSQFSGMCRSACRTGECCKVRLYDRERM